MRDELLSFYLYKQAMKLKNVYKALFFALLYSTCTAQTQGKYVIIARIIHIPRDVSHCICILYVSQSAFIYFLRIFVSPSRMGLVRLYCEILGTERFPYLIEFYFLSFPLKLFYCSLMAQIEA